MKIAAVSNWSDYLILSKPRVVALMLFTSLIGMLLASPGLPPMDIVVLGNLGIALCAASAAALNHLVDRQVDARMQRTSNRPLPEGRLSQRQAKIFIAVTGVTGSLILLYFANALAALLTVLALFGYAVIYTVFLKRATPLNIVIGGAAGAAPPLLGWVAVTGQISPLPLLLVLIIYTWTPPHFWALALHRKKDYAKVGIPMMPVTHGDNYTRWQILFYTLLLIAASLLPFASGYAGPVYFIGALSLGAGYLYYAVMLLIAPGDKLNIAAFRYSIIYLMALFAIILVDHYL